MKNKNRKKYIKEASVLFITVLMVFSTCTVYADTSNTINFEAITNSAPNTMQSVLVEESLYYYDGVDETYITAGGTTFEAAIRLTPTELAPYDGYDIVAIRFHHHEGTRNANMKLYDQGSSTAPGSLLISVPYSASGEGWVRVDLSTAIALDVTHDIWVSVEIPHNEDEYPMSADDGPEVPQKGDFVGFGGNWFEIWEVSDPEDPIHCNWNIELIVDNGGGGPLVANANGPYEGLVGEEIAFTGTASGGVPPFSFEWDFGDGITSSLQNPVHFYVEEGEYDVVLTVTDDEQNQAVATTTATISKEFNWVHYDDGENVFSIGLMGGGSFEWGIRLTPEELTGYYGEELTTVRFHHGEAGIPEPEHTGNIYIYEDGTPTSPGQIIPEATTPWTHNGSGWVEITLASPVVINASHDLWITLDVTHADGENPAGVADGPSIPGKSCLIKIYGQWFNLIDLQPNLDYNWNLWAGFENDSIPLITSANGPYEGVVGEEIAFTGSVVGGVSPYSFEWTFGDGNISSEQNPEHIYSEDGIFEVTLTVTDSDQNIAMNTTTATIVEDAGEPELSIGKITGGLAKIDVEIKNIGDTEASNVTCRISVSGGLLKFIDKNVTIQISNISANKIKIASLKPIIGLGKISINVTASAEGLESVSKEIEGRVFFFFVLIS